MDGTSNTFGSMGGNFKAAYPEVAMKKGKKKWKVLSDLMRKNVGAMEHLPKPPKVPKP